MEKTICRAIVLRMLFQRGSSIGCLALNGSLRLVLKQSVCFFMLSNA